MYMGKGCIKDNDNVYFCARKEAATYNEKLFSREGAAELLGVSVSTLGDYELGNTKVVPVDKVVLMADLYHCPELKTRYCKYDCPIGKTMPVATEVTRIDNITLRLLRELDIEKITHMKKGLIEIAMDGIISEEEKPELKVILKRLDDLAIIISEIRLLGEKVLKE